VAACATRRATEAARVAALFYCPCAGRHPASRSTAELVGRQRLTQPNSGHDRDAACWSAAVVQTLASSNCCLSATHTRLFAVLDMYSHDSLRCATDCDSHLISRV
jgi:hypothetical protein